MPIDVTNERRFEEDIEAFFLTEQGGYTKTTDTYDPAVGLYIDTLIGFIKATQPKEWTRFENTCQSDPIKKFCIAFNNACDANGLISVLRHGFKHRGITFRVCYFKPESHLNKTATVLYQQNVCNVVRQWHYSADNNKSVDMVLVINGIPVFALELKNQYTGQNVDNAKRQWMYDRDPRELPFQFNKRILAYFCVDHTDVFMATKLAKGDTYFLNGPAVLKKLNAFIKNVNSGNVEYSSSVKASAITVYDVYEGGEIVIENNTIENVNQGIAIYKYTYSKVYGEDWWAGPTTDNDGVVVSGNTITGYNVFAIATSNLNYEGNNANTTVVEITDNTITGGAAEKAIKVGTEKSGWKVVLDNETIAQ